uniref:Sarcocystatin-A n=1 Tax=Sarcophaga peregrina TaxID=7386 RepID=CYTA_SARPE|nr:RecName: Full=Sarcocystatin-A; Flags: Precursor [Sarcophaga peregrina]AAA29985.1 sarcocystatin A [Sarcophaga peregrina]
MKYVLILCVITLATVAYAQPQCVGCPSEVKGDKLKQSEETLNKSLSKLAAGDGPTYKLVKINSATTQVVSGSKDVINADLKDENDKTKTCDITIWSQPWLENGIEVTFNCPGEPKVVKKHSA